MRHNFANLLPLTLSAWHASPINNERVLIKGQQMAITTENAMRMIAITSAPTIEEADFPFFRNHISSFVEWLGDHAVSDLVQHGMDELFARSMIGTITQMAKLAGANDLFDYGNARMLFEENGLDSDNA